MTCLEALVTLYLSTYMPLTDKQISGLDDSTNVTTCQMHILFYDNMYYGKWIFI